MFPRGKTVMWNIFMQYIWLVSSIQTVYNLLTFPRPEINPVPKPVKSTQSRTFSLKGMQSGCGQLERRWKAYPWLYCDCNSVHGQKRVRNITHCCVNLQNELALEWCIRTEQAFRMVWKCVWCSEGQREGSVGEVGENVDLVAAACDGHHLRNEHTAH